MRVCGVWTAVLDRRSGDSSGDKGGSVRRFAFRAWRACRIIIYFGGNRVVVGVPATQSKDRRPESIIFSVPVGVHATTTKKEKKNKKRKEMNKTPPAVGPCVRRNFISCGSYLDQSQTGLPNRNPKPTPAWLSGAIARSGRPKEEIHIRGLCHLHLPLGR